MTTAGLSLTLWFSFRAESYPLCQIVTFAPDLNYHFILWLKTYINIPTTTCWMSC